MAGWLKSFALALFAFAGLSPALAITGDKA